MVYINKMIQDMTIIFRTYVKKILIHIERTAETKTIHLQGIKLRLRPTLQLVIKGTLSTQSLLMQKSYDFSTCSLNKMRYTNDRFCQLAVTVNISPQ
jgi:hypothetical protein